MGDNYATPEWLMKMFDGYFDPCPLNSNPDKNGLEIDWKDYTFVNPPYSKPLPWVEKAIEENKKGKRIVMLLKADTSTKLFAKINEARGKILWFNKRLKFLDGKDAKFPSMLVFFTEERFK